MYTVAGTIKNGIVALDEPLNGWEGQPVLVTILDEGEDGAAPSLDEVGADIRSLDPNPANVIQPTESLAALLADVSSEPPIDSVAWNLQWAAIEDETKTRDRPDEDIVFSA